MDKFVKRTKRIKDSNANGGATSFNQGSSNFSRANQTTTSPTPNFTSNPTSNPIPTPGASTPSTSTRRNSPPQTSVHNIIADPGLRHPLYQISKDPIEKENIRRAYLIKGPSQPLLNTYPTTIISGRPRRFVKSWFGESKYTRWLEYSESKDAVFCLYCYLFAFEFGDAGYGHESFVGTGFRNWKKKDRLDLHLGDHNSIHNKCRKSCEDLLNTKKHIDVALANLSEKEKSDYEARLRATVKCIRHLVKQKQAFRGHDESRDSLNRGNFIELLKFLALANEDVKNVVLDNAPKNAQMTSPEIQKQVTHCMSILTTKKIIEELGDSFFSILIDEARDVSCKEQMGVVLRYVNKGGFVVERFLCIVHVVETTAIGLKTQLEQILATWGLSLSRVRGQGYDGASNMSGIKGGLQKLILDENPSAYYVHCFAHQLQLALVTATKKKNKLRYFFDDIAQLVNIVGGSCKRREFLREAKFRDVVAGIAAGEIETGTGLNQEETLHRPGDTRWNSHYSTIIGIMSLFSPIRELLEVIEDDESNDKSTAAHYMLQKIDHFEFVFYLHMMKKILGVTYELSLALQKKDQDIVNALHLVKMAKHRLNIIREDFEYLWEASCEFCKKHDIETKNMEDDYVPPGRRRRGLKKRSNTIYFKNKLFYKVIDYQYQQLNMHFDDRNCELLSCLACFDPRNSFARFDKKKLVELAEFYPMEFNEQTRMLLEEQLDSWYFDLTLDDSFKNLNGIGELSQKMVEKGKYLIFPLVYLLLKLALTLPVATATVERIFSAMGLIKTDLRSKIGDEWFNDLMVPYIEKEFFNTITDDQVIKEFQKMKKRRCPLNLEGRATENDA